MAKMLPGFFFTGTLSNISAYKRRGSDEIILRSKGGASKQKIKTSPAFEKTRRINAEFGGRSSSVKWIMKMLWPQKALADYNIMGALNALIKPIQMMDTESEYGKRNILISRNPRLLEGFNLNRQNPFDTIVRNPLSFSVSRDEFSARVDIPALLPGINFYVPGKYPMYSLVTTLGLLPDMFYSSHRYEVPAAYEKVFPYAIVKETPWYPVMNGSPAAVLEMNLPQAPDNSFSLILSAGIRFGTMSDTVTVQQVKHAGAAKILGVG